MTGTSEWGDPGDTGRRVAHRRRELGLSVADVAERAGMDPSYLEYVESQPAQLTHSALVRLATALETTPAALSGGGIDRPPGEFGRGRRQSRLDTLTPEECRELLGRGGVGRIVFHDVRGPVALPVNYRMWNDDVVFRTAALSSLRGAQYAQQLSFEVDHIDGAMQQGWSVLVRGYAHEVRDAEELQAVEQLAVEPWAGEDRPVYIRIETARCHRPAHPLGLTEAPPTWPCPSLPLHPSSMPECSPCTRSRRSRSWFPRR